MGLVLQKGVGVVGWKRWEKGGRGGHRCVCWRGRGLPGLWRVVKRKKRMTPQYIDTQHCTTTTHSGGRADSADSGTLIRAVVNGHKSA